jgi:hypothetical protein
MSSVELNDTDVTYGTEPLVRLPAVVFDPSLPVSETISAVSTETAAEVTETTSVVSNESTITTPPVTRSRYLILGWASISSPLTPAGSDSDVTNSPLPIDRAITRVCETYDVESYFYEPMRELTERMRVDAMGEDGRSHWSFPYYEYINFENMCCILHDVVMISTFFPLMVMRHDVYFETLALVQRFVKSVQNPLFLNKAMLVATTAQLLIMKRSFRFGRGEVKPVMTLLIEGIHEQTRRRVLDGARYNEEMPEHEKLALLEKTRKGIVAMESLILNSVGWHLHCAGPHHMYELLLKNLRAPDVDCEIEMEETVELCGYMCMLTMSRGLHFDFENAELLLAAASVCASLHELHGALLAPCMLTKLGLDPVSVYKVARDMHRTAWRFGQVFNSRPDMLAEGERPVATDVVLSRDEMFLFESMAVFKSEDMKELTMALLLHPFRPNALWYDGMEVPDVELVPESDMDLGCVRCVMPPVQSVFYEGYKEVPGSWDCLDLPEADGGARKKPRVCAGGAAETTSAAAGPAMEGMTRLVSREFI